MQQCLDGKNSPQKCELLMSKGFSKILPSSSFSWYLLSRASGNKTYITCSWPDLAENQPKNMTRSNFLQIWDALKKLQWLSMNVPIACEKNAVGTRWNASVFFSVFFFGRPGFFTATCQRTLARCGDVCWGLVLEEYASLLVAWDFFCPSPHWMV